MTASLTIACLALMRLDLSHILSWRILACGRARRCWPAFDSEDADWPTVAVIIPARDEARDVAAGPQLNPRTKTIRISPSFLWMTTAATTRPLPLAKLPPRAGREAVILQGKPLPAAWTGKLWALHQGISMPRSMKPTPRLSAADGRGHPLCAMRMWSGSSRAQRRTSSC